MTPIRLHEFAVSQAARVRAAVAPMMSEARISATQTSQQTSGHVVTLLESRGDWWHVRSEDGYEGWMHRGYLEPASGDERDWPVTTGAIVRRADGLVRPLPFGARVAPDSMVLSGESHDDDDRLRHYPAHATAIAHTAESMFPGAPYLWGGVTPWGCDCSGFVQAVFAMHGVALPRDAWQQASAGEAVVLDDVRDDARTAAVLHESDLLFFSDREDRRITHVALWLRGVRFVHSSVSRGGVTVEQLAGAAAPDAYVETLRRQFVSARRVVPPAP
jgi:cell wall-associated NlpC family hydrolase